MALDRTAVETMIDSGHASVAHLARHFDVSVPEIESFLRENGINFPHGMLPQYRHISKLASAQLLDKVGWRQLVFDDPEQRWVNGIDLGTTDGKIQAQDIVIHYQGELRCLYTNEPTNTVMAFDGNTQNFLVTNLVPVSQEAINARDINPDEEIPMLVAHKTYTFEGSNENVEMSIHLIGRLDPTIGLVFNERYIDAIVDQWVRPYFEEIKLDCILPQGVPKTPEMFALWLWRHLSTVAFLKGLARIDVKLNSGATAVVSKDLYLQMVVGLLQRAVQSRATVPGPSNLIIPTAKDIGNLKQMNQ